MAGGDKLKQLKHMVPAIDESRPVITGNKHKDKHGRPKQTPIAHYPRDELN